MEGYFLKNIIKKNYKLYIKLLCNYVKKKFINQIYFLIEKG